MNSTPITTTLTRILRLLLCALLLAPEPTMVSKVFGVAGLVTAAGVEIQAWEELAGYARSLSASQRVGQLQRR